MQTFLGNHQPSVSWVLYAYLVKMIMSILKSLWHFYFISEPPRAYCSSPRLQILFKLFCLGSHHFITDLSLRRSTYPCFHLSPSGIYTKTLNAGFLSLVRMTTKTLTLFFAFENSQVFSQNCEGPLQPQTYPCFWNGAPINVWEQNGLLLSSLWQWWYFTLLFASNSLSLF